MRCHRSAHHSPISSPKIWLISGAVMKSPARPIGSPPRVVAVLRVVQRHRHEGGDRQRPLAPGCGGRSWSASQRVRRPRQRRRRGAAPRPPDDQRRSGDQHRDRQQLAHRRAEDQEAELHVGLAEQFARHAGDRIAGEKQPGDAPRDGAARRRARRQTAAGTAGCPRRTPRRAGSDGAAAAPPLGKHHGPRHIGRPPVQLAVDEVGDAAKEQADRDRLGDDVGKREQRQLAGTGEQQDRDGHAERAAVERHAAMPQVERLERVIDVIAGLVEQHVADAAAEHDAERRPYQEIVDVLARDQMRRPVGRGAGNSASRSAARRYRPAHTSGSRTVRATIATGSIAGNGMARSGIGVS